MSDGDSSEPPWERSEDSELLGTRDGSITICDAQFPVDVNHMCLDGVHRYVEVIGEFAVGESTREVRQDLELSQRQGLDKLAVPKGW